MIVLVTVTGGTCEGDHWQNTDLYNLDYLPEGGFKSAILNAYTGVGFASCPYQDYINNSNQRLVTTFPAIVQARVNISVF